MIDQKHVNLFKAFSEFVFALRQHIVANIKANVSGDWFDFYVTTTEVRPN